MNYMNKEYDDSDSEMEEDDHLNEISDRNVSEGFNSQDISGPINTKKNVPPLQISSKPQEQLKQVIGGGLKQPMQAINKLNLGSIKKEPEILQEE